MTQTIQLKRSSVAANVPTTGQLALGEIGINTNDGKLFIKKDDGAQSIVEVGGLGVPSYVHVGKSATQDIGGADLSETIINWDTELFESSDFTHDTVTNNSRITCNFTGRVFVSGVVGGTQGGSARTTIMTGFKVNGGATSFRGSTRNYSRGSAYGDLSAEWSFELNVTSGDYIELVSKIDDTGAAYTINSISAECDLVVRRIDVGAKGTDGNDGAQGVAGADGDITWEGAWSAGTYLLNQAVEDGGSSYVCNTTSTTSQPPSADWDLMAQQGATGPAGGGISSYMYPIWAEENGTLGNATYEWAFGNGANTPNTGGLTMYVPSGWTCDIVAMSLRIGGGTATVEIVKNGTVQGSAANVVLSSGQSATNELATPLSIANNDYINFRTTSASGTVAPAVATCWVRMTPV